MNYVQVPAINKHLSNIYDDGELDKKATISILEIVQNEGGRKIARKMDFYSLDAIISVGYRVNSAKATQFRIWATKTLKEFITKGFVLDDERLKQGKTVFGKDYFRELLERVRSIRATAFRQWATAVLRDYALRGYVIDKKRMGLTTWENSPQGKIVKTDVAVAKNYLTEADDRSILLKLKVQHPANLAGLVNPWVYFFKR